VTVDPRSVPAIRAGLAGVLADPDRAADLARRGRARAAEFTWARTAEVTLAMLVVAAEGR
jgi:hypothetical protein